MIEVLAAVAGAAITAAAMGLGGFSKRNDEARTAVIRLDHQRRAHRHPARTDPHRHARRQPRDLRPPQSCRAAPSLS
jgi:hypothetical protein